MKKLLLLLLINGAMCEAAHAEGTAMRWLITIINRARAQRIQETIYEETNEWLPIDHTDIKNEFYLALRIPCFNQRLKAFQQQAACACTCEARKIARDLQKAGVKPPFA